MRRARVRSVPAGTVAVVEVVVIGVAVSSKAKSPSKVVRLFGLCQSSFVADSSFRTRGLDGFAERSVSLRC